MTRPDEPERSGRFWFLAGHREIQKRPKIPVNSVAPAKIARERLAIFADPLPNADCDDRMTGSWDVKVRVTSPLAHVDGK